MRFARSYRGQPLVALLALVGGWIALRAIMWDAGSGAVPALPERAAVEAGAKMAVPPALVRWREAARPGARTAMAPGSRATAAPSAPRPGWSDVVREARPSTPFVPPPRTIREVTPTPPATGVMTPGLQVMPAASQHLLWLRAMTRLPMPAAMSSRVPVPMRAGPAAPASRWSGDGWLLLRGGAAGAGAAIVPPSYGGSQAGAVIRYRLGPPGGHRPALYLRATAALRGPRDEAVALGVSARPIAQLPVTVAAEARAVRQTGGTRVRPAGFAVTDIAPQELGRGLRLEVYGQAGYVGGPGKTAFADGQMRLDRALVGTQDFSLRAGAGAWGGAQKGASRIDIGPTIAIGPAGANARIAVDWRLRVAGDARPRSGPALTLSAGF